MEMKFAVSKLPFGARLVLFLAFAVGGAAVQYLLPGAGGTFLGLLVMVPGVVADVDEELPQQADGPRPRGLAAGDGRGVQPDPGATSTATRKQRFSPLHRGGLGRHARGRSPAPWRCSSVSAAIEPRGRRLPRRGGAAAAVRLLGQRDPLDAARARVQDGVPRAARRAPSPRAARSSSPRTCASTRTRRTSRSPRTCA